MKRLCIIAESYPTCDQPEFTFVQQLAHSLTARGIDCTIIAPQSLTKAIFRRKNLRPFSWVDKCTAGGSIIVYQPLTLSFSNTSSNFLKRITEILFMHAVHRVCNSNVGLIDAVYCYFWHIGIMSAKALNGIKKRLYVQASECDITLRPWMYDQKLLESVEHVICASGKNREETLREGLTTIDKTTIVVNGYNPDLFYYKDQRESRRLFGFDENVFIAIFVGGFIERKGAARVSEAIDGIDEDIASIFIGQGSEKPQCKGILFEGPVSHNEIVHYLNCADVFVLPTTAEGCCNSIIEALACGLPVISSNCSFNDEILDESCSLRINPRNVTEIREAILTLKNNVKLRNKMSENAKIKARQLTIQKRAENIEKIIWE